MLRAISRALVVSAALLCIGAPVTAQQQMTGSTEFTWSHAYQLTPLEHKRLRAIGLTEDEIFLAARTANLAGRQHVDDVVQMILRGETAHSIAQRYGLAVDWITEKRPEWTTEAWKQAVDRGDPWWVSSSAAMSVAGSRSEMRDRR
jgi:hypothetical protein